MMRRTLSPIVVAILALAVGCRSAAVGTGATTVSYTGTVQVSGVEGMTTTSVRIADRSVTVAGPLLAEVRALSGARVTIEGTRVTGGPGEVVEVTGYQVIEVNGQTPYVGVLVAAGDGYRVEEGDTRITLDTWPSGLSAEVGAKIWVTGTLVGGRLQVQSYGVIRPR